MSNELNTVAFRHAALGKVFVQVGKQITFTICAYERDEQTHKFSLGSPEAVWLFTFLLSGIRSPIRASL